jgi:hypothetical protein
VADGFAGAKLLRDRLLPLVPLAGLLRLDRSEAAGQEPAFVVVTQVGAAPLRHHRGPLTPRRRGQAGGADPAPRDDVLRQLSPNTNCSFQTRSNK